MFSMIDFLRRKRSEVDLNLKRITFHGDGDLAYRVELRKDGGPDCCVYSTQNVDLAERWARREVCSARRAFDSAEVFVTWTDLVTGENGYLNTTTVHESTGKAW
jgi:hypothetical protein